MIVSLHRKTFGLHKKEGVLYAIALDVPENGQFLIRSLAEHKDINEDVIESITVLGEVPVPEWKFEETGFSVKAACGIKRKQALVAKIVLNYLE